MKKTKKVLLLGLCAVLLVAASVLGTMAYLTDSKSVTNTFTVGNVNIDLDEAEVTPNGEEVAGATRVKENKYKLMPGHKYTKDPTVKVLSGSEDCYLFVKVTNGIADKNLEAATVAGGYKTIADQIIDNGWKPVAGNDGVYVYTNGTEVPVAVSAGESKVVFNEFEIKGEATNDSLQAFAAASPEQKIIIDAYAIQKDGFDKEGITIADIWAAAKN